MDRKSILNSQDLPTPYYAYDLDVLRKTLSAARLAADKFNFHVHYAIKANSHPRILKEVMEVGFGIDCVSGQEVRHALDNGFQSENIAFAGVGKADWEIDLAIEHEIFTLNVESIEELVVINERAEMAGKKVDIAIRFNPDVNAKTHHYITTGLEENKFGISRWQFNELVEVVRASSNVNLVGLHFHIGSQIQSLEPFKNLCTRINEYQSFFLDQGFHIKHINAGGGLGVDYNNPDDLNNPDFEPFFQLFSDYLELKPTQQLHFELGRSLVANCGDLMSRIVYVKKGQKTNFVILDAGMTELIRPALYQAFHKIENLTNSSAIVEQIYDVVGPICESSDCFGKAVQLPKCSRGDLIAIRSAGAYGECMANQYNMRQPNKPVFFPE